LYAIRVEPGVPPNAGLFLSQNNPLERIVAKVVKKRIQKQRGFREGSIPLARENYTIMGVGIVVIVAGYIAMLQDSIEGFLPLVVSPILLVVGYCVLIPLGILYRKPQPSPSDTPQMPKVDKPQP
jgi:hypothetical protein